MFWGLGFRVPVLVFRVNPVSSAGGPLLATNQEPTRSLVRSRVKGSGLSAQSLALRVLVFAFRIQALVFRALGSGCEL